MKNPAIAITYKIDGQLESFQFDEMIGRGGEVVSLNDPNVSVDTVVVNSVTVWKKGEKKSGKEPTPCKYCEAPVIWLKTKNDKNICIEPAEYEGEPLFVYGKHIAHIANCPNAPKR